MERTILKEWTDSGAVMEIAGCVLYVPAEQLERLQVELGGYLYERDEMRSGQAAETF